jgi:ribosomal protein S18 acetylase RimI-like enzyme
MQPPETCQTPTDQDRSDIRIVPFVNAVHGKQVVTLWETVFGYKAPHNSPRLVIDKKLAIDDQLFFVATTEEAVVGTIMAGYDGHRGWIYSVAVATSHRRKGIGSLLVSHAERELTLRGCVKINLQILKGNEDAVRFYSSLGYSEEQRISMGKPIPSNVPERK